MDEDSILFQAMKNEMSPQVDPASMRVIDPNSQYQLGVEMRARSPTSGLANPARMARPPSDFAGRPSGANENVRGPVIDRSQQFSEQRFENMIRQAQEEAAAKGTTSGGLQSFRNFLRGLWED